MGKGQNTLQEEKHIFPTHFMRGQICASQTWENLCILCVATCFKMAILRRFAHVAHNSLRNAHFLTLANMRTLCVGKYVHIIRRPYVMAICPRNAELVRWDFPLSPMHFMHGKWELPAYIPRLLCVSTKFCAMWVQPFLFLVA